MLRETFSDDFYELSFECGFSRESNKPETIPVVMPNIHLTYQNVPTLSIDNGDLNIYKFWLHMCSISKSNALLTMTLTILLSDEARENIDLLKYSDQSMYINFDAVDLIKSMIDYNLSYYSHSQVTVEDFLSLGYVMPRTYGAASMYCKVSIDSGSIDLPNDVLLVRIHDSDERPNKISIPLEFYVMESSSFKAAKDENNSTNINFSRLNNITFNVGLNLHFTKEVFSMKFLNESKKKKPQFKTQVNLISNYKNGGELYVA